MSTDPKHNLPPVEKTQAKSVSFAELILAAQNIDSEKPKALEEHKCIFDSLRTVNELSNAQIDEYLNVVERNSEKKFLQFLTIATVSIWQSTKKNDSKIASGIQIKCKGYFENFKIMESTLTKAERNLCLQSDSKYVMEFLAEAKKQSEKCERQIPNLELAILSFICFSLYCKISYGGDFRIQMLIDRAIAEFFSEPKISGIKPKDLACKSIGNVLSAKVYSARKLSELTYLYAGTSQKISEQAAHIEELDCIRRNQAERISSLSGEISSLNRQIQQLQESEKALESKVQLLSDEKAAAEDMLDYEKNKFEKLIVRQAAGAAARISKSISLDLVGLRDIAKNLEETSQKRVLRRVDRIEQYLQEFKGE